MNHGMRIFGGLALTLGLLAQIALCQKTPGPAPRPAPSGPPNGTVNPNSPSVQPSQQPDEFVMFLTGHVTTDDGTPVPKDIVVERVCNAGVRQQVHATSRGDFSMQLGSMADSFLDASGERPALQGLSTRNSGMGGVSRRDLQNCELRASVAGFHSSTVSLVELAPFDSKSVDVGGIVVQRREKVKGMTLNAAPYKAPKDAREAYEKGLEAERKGKLANARQYFERTVQLYPKNANAWFQLGNILQKQNENDEARKAFTQATTVDTRFLPPYLSLASMAFESENWRDVLDFTGHILDLNPLDHVSGYVLDLDPVNYGEAYFYNSVANYKLNRMEAAERSGLKAERVDLRTHFPQLHLVMAEVFARKNSYPTAIAELQTYLALAPHAPDEPQVRERLAKLEQLNNSQSASEKPN